MASGSLRALSPPTLPLSLMQISRMNGWSGPANWRCDCSRAPRALFFPDGMLVAHGVFPLADLHPKLIENANWNDPACLSDFVWTRAHPTARKKFPNRFSRGSQFGYEDFGGVVIALPPSSQRNARNPLGHSRLIILVIK